jgi:HSP20 family protein
MIDRFLTDNTFGLLRRMTTDIERLFGEVAFDRPGLGEPRLLGDARWVPTVDVFEKNGSLIVRADLPGLTKNDVNVEVTDHQLTIQGERKAEFEETREGVHRQERAYGSFYRALPLPEQIKPEDVKATFANGVLEVAMPLPSAKQLPKPRHVEVQDLSTERKKTAA